MNQTTIFDFIYPKYKITKPIRLIELFAGYGSQYLALKYLGANVKHYKICEWATKSIQAYNDLHIQDYFDYSGDLSDDNILKVLIELGVSINYNEPATREQLKRQDFRKIYNNIIATNNLVNIQNAKGEDFKIVNKDQYEYIMTYSFPCQDLSLAGKGKGMADTTTRSGMLWEVERILSELKELNQLPQILLMENVPQVHGSDNVEHFNKWQLALENMGYKNYFQDLIATDYGIPQTRNRCFMVSILGDYSYSFPQKIPLKLKLKDLLEEKVDEKYYLSEKMINYIVSEDDKYIVSKSSLNINREGVVTIGNYSKSNHNASRIVDKNYSAPTVMENHGTITAIQLNDLKIRKLTPRECGRLMNVKDEDITKLLKNQSNSSAYHLFGDSICTNVLMAIFGKLLDVNWIEKFKEIENKFIDK